MPFTIVRDDLTRIKVDAIVNTANPKPLIGTGTDFAIYQAAGAKKLLKERQKIGEIDRGDAAITGAYSLPAKYIIHTVGPIWTGGTSGEADLLRSCYQRSLELAQKKRCKSIAFPLISTGNYGFPKDLALQIVVDTVSKFLEDSEMMIFLVVFGSDTTRLSEKLFADIEERITDDYVESKSAEEYSFQMQPWEDGMPADRYRRNSYHQVRREDYYPDLPNSAASFRDAEMDFSMLEAPSVQKEQSVKPKAPRLPSPGISTSKKSSSAIKRNLKSLLAQKDETFSQMLLRLIKEKGMTNAQAYKKANQDKKSFSKIKNGDTREPKKKTVLAYALALELNLDETKDLLARAGLAFSPSSNFDKVIQYCIESKEYNIFEIEIILYDLGLESLCNFGNE